MKPWVQIPELLKTKTKRKENLGLRVEVGSVVQHLSSMHQTLGFISSITKKKSLETHDLYQNPY
jgi:hypothetical protein